MVCKKLLTRALSAAGRGGEHSSAKLRVHVLVAECCRGHEHLLVDVVHKEHQGTEGTWLKLLLLD